MSAPRGLPLRWFALYGVFVLGSCVYNFGGRGYSALELVRILATPLVITFGGGAWVIHRAWKRGLVLRW